MKHQVALGSDAGRQPVTVARGLGQMTARHIRPNRGATPESSADDLHYPGTYAAGSYNRLVSQKCQGVASNMRVWFPYESKDQVTSGVLVEAIAAGKPVITTAFPHAIEMLSTGAGTVVPHSDADAMSRALRNVRTNPRVATQRAQTGRALASELLWPAVAAKDETVFANLVDDPAAAIAHIGVRLSTATPEIRPASG